MRTPNRPRLAVLCLGLGLGLCLGFTAPAARAQKPPEVVIGQSIQAMSEVTRNPKTGMPRLVMREARGIVIVPNMFKAGFVVGARFGRGLLMVRQPDGSWSNPVFIHLVGGSFGLQAGAQKTDLILVFQAQRGLDRFLKGRDKLTLGVDVGAAAGPVGKRFEAATDAALKSEILSYSNSRGVFAGVSAEGGTLQIDWRANMHYYGRPVSVGEILAVNSTLPVTGEVGVLQALLSEKTAYPTPVVPGEVIQDETIIIEGDAPVVEGVAPPAADRPARPRPRVIRPEPDAADDLNPLPEARPAPGSAPPANDEDLPAAIPDPRPARPENKPLPAKPRVEPEPRPKADVDPLEDLDDIPPLDPPKE